eukprot:9835089-Ditylum_brightwellii.AAC.1
MNLKCRSIPHDEIGIFYESGPTRVPLPVDLLCNWRVRHHLLRNQLRLPAAPPSGMFRKLIDLRMYGVYT